MTNEEIRQRLAAPFPPEDVEWRASRAGIKNGKPWVRVLAYITNRAIQQRLDEVFGVDGWENCFDRAPEGGVLCGITVHMETRSVTKWDGAQNTDIEATKGGLSGAMKRAACQLGIGRYLYNLTENFAECYEDSRRGRYVQKVKDGGKDRWISWDPPSLPSWALPSLDGNPQEPRTAKSEDATTPIGDDDCVSVAQTRAIYTRLGKTYGSAEKVRDLFKEWLVDEGMMPEPDGEELTLKQLPAAKASALLDDEAWEKSMKRFGEFQGLIGLITSAGLDPATLKAYCIAKDHIELNKAGAYPWCNLTKSARKLIEEAPEPLGKQVRAFMEEQG